MTGIGYFINDSGIAQQTAAEINEAYTDTPYPRPHPIDVIHNTIRHVAQDLRDQAAELSQCTKVDDCTAQAAVLRALASWMEPR